MSNRDRITEMSNLLSSVDVTALNGGAAFYGTEDHAQQSKDDLDHTFDKVKGWNQDTFNLDNVPYSQFENLPGDAPVANDKTGRPLSPMAAAVLRAQNDMKMAEAQYSAGIADPDHMAAKYLAAANAHLEEAKAAMPDEMAKEQAAFQNREQARLQNYAAQLEGNAAPAPANTSYPPGEGPANPAPASANTAPAQTPVPPSVPPGEGPPVGALYSGSPTAPVLVLAGAPLPPGPVFTLNANGGTTFFAGLDASVSVGAIGGVWVVGDNYVNQPGYVSFGERGGHTFRQFNETNNITINNYNESRAAGSTATQTATERSSSERSSNERASVEQASQERPQHVTLGEQTLEADHPALRAARAATQSLEATHDARAERIEAPHAAAAPQKSGGGHHHG